MYTESQKNSVEYAAIQALLPVIEYIDSHVVGIEDKEKFVLNSLSTLGWVALKDYYKANNKTLNISYEDFKKELD